MLDVGVAVAAYLSENEIEQRPRRHRGFNISCAYSKSSIPPAQIKLSKLMCAVYSGGIKLGKFSTPPLGVACRQLYGVENRRHNIIGRKSSCRAALNNSIAYEAGTQQRRDEAEIASSPGKGGEK